MGRNAHVDQVPMLHDDGVPISRSAELAILASPDTSVTVGNNDEMDIIGNDRCSTMRTPAPSGRIASEYDAGRHEHLLGSGPMGKCNDPCCTTCRSYFDYAENIKAGRRVGRAWRKFVWFSTLVAVFVDPLFFLLLSVSAKQLCLVFNNTAAVVVTVIRSVTDSVNLCNIFLQFRLAYVGLEEDLVDEPRRIAKQYAKSWFLLDAFTALPLPQMMIWIMASKMLTIESGVNYAKGLGVVVLLQNIPRSIRIIRPLIEHWFENVVLKFVFKVLLYNLTGYIVGSFWYLLGLQRVSQCLREGCQSETNATNPCEPQYLYCGLRYNPSDQDRVLWREKTSIRDNCIVNPTFSYGIYASGVKVITADSMFMKYVYSTCWGFQQVSTLAGNQDPNMSVEEVVFTFVIIAVGVLLLALLIGSMQSVLVAFDDSRGKRKQMESEAFHTARWMERRRLPDRLRRRVRQAGLNKWRMTGGLDEEEIFRNLPDDLRMDIQRYLYTDLVKKVHLFEVLEDHILNAIYALLYPKLYIPGSKIIQAKQPVERMLFIVRGYMESLGDDGCCATLKEGQFCGEELLSWYIDTVVISKKDMHKHVLGNVKYPKSSRTVTCLTAVEAFCLDNNGLEYITTRYKYALRDLHVQGAIRNLSLYWRSLAAIRIQGAWRKYLERRANSPAGRGNRHRQTRLGRMYDAERRNSNATNGE